jgi:protocatechuate 3,4-dioxygenase beta subunit
VHPAADYPPYRSSQLRHPREPLVVIPQTLSELTGPVYPYGTIGGADADLTRQHAGEPIGQRIIVAGRVLDEDGRPVRNTLVEVWQANAGGRYAHRKDRFPAALDPNFSGAGRTITDEEGRWRFVTILPGRYPWPNHYNAWRPSHIHFSLFGQNLLTRLVTQMYFPGDPLHALDPVMNSVRDDAARARLVCAFDIDLTEENWALGFRWDIMLRGRNATPFE